MEASHPKRERDRRRRLAVLSLSALERPILAGELGRALGEDLTDALLEASEEGFCLGGPAGLFAPTSKACLELGMTLLSAEETAAALVRLLPLVSDPGRAFLLSIMVDPAGAGRERAQALGEGSPLRPIASALRSAVAGDEVEGSLDLGALGPLARTACAALAGACHGLMRSRRQSACRTLLLWSLGPRALGGTIAPAQWPLAAALFQALMDSGRRDEAIAVAGAARDALNGEKDTFGRLLLMALEGHLRAERGDLSEARALFTKVEMQARDAGLSELTGIARIAFGTLALHDGQTEAAARLYRSALERVSGNSRYEAVALQYLALTHLRQGRSLEAQAAFRESNPLLDSVALRCAGYTNAISCDAFLGDVESASANLAVLERLAPDTAHGRLAVALSRAYVKVAGTDLTGALEVLNPTVMAEAARRPTYLVAMGWLRAGCLLVLGRVAEAAAAHLEVAAVHHLNRLSSHVAAVHILDADLAVATGDVERARRALRRARERPERLQAFDFELRANAVAVWLSEREGSGRKAALAREEAKRSYQRIIRGLTPEAVQRFRRSMDRPRLMAAVGLPDLAPPAGLSYLRGASTPFTAMVAQLRRVARSEVNVLLVGETGAGKELAARALHDLSARSAGPFVAINCAAMTDELLLSELFGHEKGAFTGAGERRVGRFEQADGGTLFLDEIGDISPRGQASLLRAIQERAFERVGGTTTLQANVRIVTATNRDLAAAVKAGEFRKDLYFRLRGLEVSLPPLREREDDALLLATYFLQKSAEERGGQAKALSAEAARLVRRYPWPGNVRELRNVVQAAELLSEEAIIPASALTPLLGAEPEQARPAEAELDFYDRYRREGGDLKDFLTRVQRECLARALEDNGGNIAAAAADLGFSRSRLSQIVHADPELRRRAGRGQKRPS